MALIKKPYEISVWQDILMYVGTPLSGEGTISTKNINDLSSVDYQYYDEQRLATIGSHTMTSPMRAINPTLTRNINGIETLKFEMYYQYIDPNTGEREHNPLIDYLVNERKIKLYYEDNDPNHPDHWYDFVIKKDEEKARDNKYSFTCNSLGAAELGKTGFKVELDVELENNMGTVQELAGKILENSDWQLSETQDIIKQTVNEPLYKIYLNEDITPKYTQTRSSAPTIPSGAVIYVYYTPYANKETDYFQFIYIANESKVEVLSDRMTLVCDDINVLDLYLENVTWVNDRPDFELTTFVDEEEETEKKKKVANYRGDRYVRKQKTAYDSTLKKTVKVYKDNLNKEVYGYQTTKYYGVNAVTNYIHNSVNFGGASYWYGFGDNTSIQRIIYPPASAGTENRISYLSMKIGAPIHVDPQDSDSAIDYINSPRVMNDGIIYNYSKIKTFDKNDTYLLRMKVRKMRADGTLGSYLTYSSNFPFTCQVRKYEKVDQSTGTRCFNFLGSATVPDYDFVKDLTEEQFNNNKTNYYIQKNNSFVQCTNESTFNSTTNYFIRNNFALIKAKCETSASIEELKNNIGIFFFRSGVYGNKRQNEDIYDDLSEGESYYVEEIQLTQGIWAEATDTEPAHWVRIGEVPTVKSATINHFYYPEENIGLTNPDDYVYISEDPDDDQHPVVFSPLYSEGENQFEKIRSISAKESNRFNLLQQLCETFECWVKFYIGHEQNGRIKVVDYNYYQPLNIPTGYKYIDSDDFKQGRYYPNTHEFDGDIQFMSSNKLIKVQPGVSYYVESNISFVTFLRYDENKEYYNYDSWYRTDGGRKTFQIPDNIHYISIFLLNEKMRDGEWIWETLPSDLQYLEIYPNIENLKTYDHFSKNYIDVNHYNSVYYIPTTRRRQDKEVIFYGEILEDNPLGFKYGINLKDVTRTLDSEQIATKIIVKNNSNEYADNGFCSIARAKDNPTKENFLYNFDYYIKQGILNESILNNDLYLRDNTGSIGLYPNLADYNSQRNQIITDYANLANEITEIKGDVEINILKYNSASEELYKLTDPVSGKLVRYTGYIYEDFYDQVARAYKEDNANHIVSAYADQIYYAPSGIQNLIITAYDSSDTELSGISYYKKIVFPSAIKGSDIVNEHPEDVKDGHFKGWNALKYYIKKENYERCKKNQTIQDDEYYIRLGQKNKTPFYIKGSSNTFVQTTTYLAVDDGTTYYWYYDTLVNGTTYFQTPANTAKLKFIKTDNTARTVYVYGAYWRVGEASDDDTVNDTSTINYLEQITTLQKDKTDAEVAMNEKKALLEEYQAQYDEYTDQLKDIAKATEEIELQFITKYSRYIQEGSWHDDNYMDDDLYYLDAVQVLYQSAYPKVSYNISVLELSALDGYEPYKFGLAHRTFIEDTEFFGWTNKALNIPARERIVVTELSNSLDQPEKNTIKVQNYKNHFEDLFQRITAATQNLEYHSGDYKRAADAITADGAVNQTIMQKTMATAQFVMQNAVNQSVVIDDTGLLATKTNDPAEVVRLTSGGLLVSTDGGRNYGVAITGYGINADYLSAGIIDTEKINILSGSFPTFRWDSDGIRAYSYTKDSNDVTSYNASNYVTFNRFGLYGINGLTNFIPNTVTDVEKKASFALTWNGLFIRSNYRQGYVSISPTDDVTLYGYNNGTFGEVLNVNDEYSNNSENFDSIYYLNNRNAFYYLEDDVYIKCTTETYQDIKNTRLFLLNYEALSPEILPKSWTTGYYYLYNGEFFDLDISYIQCTQESVFDSNIIYYIQNNNEYEIAENLTEQQFNQNKTNYYYLMPDVPDDITNNIFYQKVISSSIKSTPVQRAKFGMLETSNSGEEIYGLALYDRNGRITVTTQSDGKLWLQDSMTIGKQNQTNTIYIGVGEDEIIDDNPTGRYKVIKINDFNNLENFVVYSDGTLNAKNASVNGEIIAESGLFKGIIQIGDNLTENASVYIGRGETTSSEYKIAENLTQQQFNQNKTNYYYQGYIQCTQESVFDSNIIYYIQNNNEYEIAENLTEQQFNQNKTNYYYQNYIQCTEESIFDSEIIYYTENEIYKIFRVSTVENGIDTDIFALQSDGKLLAREADISGIIHATSGEFEGTIIAKDGMVGGFTIDSDSIYVGNSKNDSPLKIYSGSGNSGNSKITVTNIDIGSGANITDYLQIGNLKLLKPTQNNNNNVLTLTENNINYFSLNNNGDIEGDGWFIKKINDKTLASFDNGSFKGEISASVISATTINTINFITEKIRSMGGAFIFKPSYEIKKIEISEENRINYIYVTLNSDIFRVNDIVGFTIEANSEAGIKIGKVVSIVVNIIYEEQNGLTEEQFNVNKSKYSYYDEENEQYVQCDENSIFNSQIIYYIKSSDYTIKISGISNTKNFNPQTITWFGNPDEDIIIGINSDNSDAGALLPKKSLSIRNFTFDNNEDTLSCTTKLLLGDLSSLDKETTGFTNISGYGLYADNVYLKGSLTTTSTNNNNYAGVNTHGPIDFNYGLWNNGNSDTSEYSGHKIIFWGGATDTGEESIQESKFIVTDKGSIFATSGEFKGSVISDSVISKSVIQAAIIEGINKNENNQNEPNLKIYDTGTNGGIGFYQKVTNIDNKDNNENDDILTLSIDSTGLTYLGNNKFIDFDTTVTPNEVVAKLARAEFGELQINNQGINSATSYLEINNSFISSRSSVIKFESNSDSNTKLNLNYQEKNGYYCLFVNEE